MADNLDLQFGRVAISLGYVTPNQLSMCLQLQKQELQNGRHYTLANVLIGKGYIDNTQQETITRHLKSLAHQTRKQKAPQLAKDTRSPTESHPARRRSHTDTDISYLSIDPERYSDFNEIGRGGMGRVYRAYDKHLDRLVALKMLIAGENVDRFLREAKTMARLKHLNIVGVHDIGRAGDNPFFTMDLVDGQSLDKILKKSTLSARRATEIMIKVSEAVHYAHTEGVIHRDLKPANIIVDENWEPKVMDFGLAKVSNEDKKLSQSGALLGTVMYMPPEQAEGKSREIDQQSDVYALGAILYEMLTGRPPFSSRTIAKALQQIFTEEITPPRKIKASIPQALENICLKALSKEKRNRYSDAAAMAEDLRLFSRGRRVHAKSSRKWLTGKTRQKLLLVSTVCLLLTFTFFLGQQMDTQTSISFTMQANIVDAEKNARAAFQIDESVWIKLSWEVEQQDTAVVWIYGDNILSYKGKIDTARKPQYIPIELKNKRPGNYSLITQLSIAGVNRKQQYHFTLIPSQIVEKQHDSHPPQNITEPSVKYAHKIQFFTSDTDMILTPPQQFSSRFLHSKVKKFIGYYIAHPVSEAVLKKYDNVQIDIEIFADDVPAGKQSVLVSQSHPYALSYLKPGDARWPTGNFRVDAFFRGEKIATDSFVVYSDKDNSLSIELRNLRFFESREVNTSQNQRNYIDRFPQSTTKFVYCLINFTNKLWRVRDHSVTFFVKYYGPKGNLFVQMPQINHLSKKHHYRFVYLGGDFQKEVLWPIGEYRVEVFANGKILTTGKFSIYKDR